MQPDFGGHVPEDNLLRRVIETGPMVKNSSDLQLMLRDMYETTYGIYDHNKDRDEDLLSLVAIREGEDGSVGGHLYERIRQFDKREILKFFGLSVTEFLELPTDIANYLVELSVQKQASNHNVARDAEQQVQQQLGLFDNQPV